MGVDCRITLPSRVRVYDVAKAIGIILGCPVSKTPCGNSFAADVSWVEDRPSVLSNCAYISISHPYGDKREFLYHFEFGKFGARGIIPRSTAVNIAMAKKLVSFFGGMVDFQDCDDKEVDFYVEEQPYINASDGEEWEKLQEKFFNLSQLTQSEIDDCEQFAAYH